MRKSPSLCLLLLVAACGVSPSAPHYASLSTTDLWRAHGTTYEQRDLGLIEAELALRGQSVSGADYLGRNTALYYGLARYARATGAGKSDVDCADFSSSAAAQKFFLEHGGPARDPMGLDRDGDGLACEWGVHLKRIARPKVTAPPALRRSAGVCHVGPRGGRYRITASGAKDYGAC